MYLEKNEEICLTRKNTTMKNCAAKSALIEMKALLSERKIAIEQTNKQLLQIKGNQRSFCINNSDAMKGVN